MKFSTTLRRGGAIVALAGSGALVAGSAGAFTGQPNSGGPPTSAAPDVVSAKITRTVAPTSPLGPQAQICFDDIINAGSIVNNSVNVTNYDSDVRPFSNNVTIDTSAAAAGKCEIATFGNGLDITQSTVLTVDANGAANNQGIGNPNEGAPLQGTTVAAVAGATTAPDLVSAVANSGANPPQIAYTFDENLDPTLSGGGAALAGKFGFYVDTDDGACASDAATNPNAACGATPNFGRRGATILGVDGPTIVVSFATTQAVQQSKLFFYDSLGGGATARDRSVAPLLGPANTSSPIAFSGQPITGGPTISSAAKQANTNGQVVDMTFAQNVVPGVVGAAAPGGNVVAYRADAGAIGGTYAIGTSGANLRVLPVTLPPTTQRDSNSVVRLGIRPGLVRNNANNASNAYGAVAISTEPSGIGLTDGPDLLTTQITDNSNRVSYTFDEPLHATPDPSGPEFRVINSDGTVINGQAGSAVVSADRKSVSVQFGGAVSGSSVAGVSNQLFAVTDAVDDTPAAGNGSPPGSVSTTLLTGDDPGTVPTAAPTTSPTASPTTPPAQTSTVKRSTKLSLSRKSSGKKFTGKLSAKSPCVAGRTVKLKRGSKTLKSKKVGKSGKYTFKVKKQKKGKIRTTVAKRTVTQGSTKFVCGAAKSKKR